VNTFISPALANTYFSKRSSYGNYDNIPELATDCKSVDESYRRLRSAVFLVGRFIECYLDTPHILPTLSPLPHDEEGAGDQCHPVRVNNRYADRKLSPLRRLVSPFHRYICSGQQCLTALPSNYVPDSGLSLIF
jgi:hypothetical protein